jgi:hypothetical protein
MFARREEDAAEEVVDDVRRGRLPVDQDVPTGIGNLAEDK